jgi:hypothetical protein
MLPQGESRWPDDLPPIGRKKRGFLERAAKVDDMEELQVRQKIADRLRIALPWQERRALYLARKSGSGGRGSSPGLA